MGKRGGKFSRGGRGGKGGRGGSRGSGGGWGNRPSYAEVDKNNANFEKYYNELGVVPEEEREQFWTALRKELPNSFRFAGSRGHALAVQQRLVEHYIPQITSVQFDGENVSPPTPIEWFPEKLAWQMTTPKNVIRKFAPFSSFQKFLVSETSVGNISRQEIVSMIPPLVMDIKPGMTVLDLCAAPGSKSAQLIEAVHGGEEARVRKVLRKVAQEQGREVSPDGMEIEVEKPQAESEDDWSDDGRATGLLIANDVDYKRAQMLVHQVKRLNSPNLLVTNHDATLFPSIQVPSEAGGPRKYLKFDRILADVPCSGDGTARKNPNVWKDWIPGNGLGLYVTQVRILVRALQMLKVGGRVVYSTCSMNPVENEAVVASAIDRCGGVSKVKVIDCSNALPGLKRIPGMSQWKIMDKTNRMWSSWEEVEAAKAQAGPGEDSSFNRLVEGMFPPKQSADDAERIPFEHCMRVYPHLQDTGGFFITVLEKQTEIKARPEYQGGASGKQTAPPPPIANVLNAIETGSNTIPSLAENGESKPTGEIPLSDGNAPPAARQNQDNVPPLVKRPLEDADAGDLDRDVKRPRQHDEAPPAVPERLEKPAGAVTDLDTRPEKKKSGQVHEEPFKYLSPDHPALESIFSFYEISPRFPRDRFMVRNATGEPAKAIYYTSTLARDILTLNEGKGMKFVHCGVKMFMKQDAQNQDICRWRIQSEGLPILESWVGEGRVVRLTKRGTLHKLLIEMFPKVAQDGWKDLGEIGERVRDIGMGCCVLRVDPSDAEDGFKERLVLPLWRSISSLNLMLPKEERKAMLLRLYNDQSELIDHSQKNRLHQEQNLAAEREAELDAAEASVNSTVAAEAATEPETFVDEQGHATLNTDFAPDVEEPTGPIGSKGAVGTEEEALEAEDMIRAGRQQVVDEQKEAADGEVVKPEEDLVYKEGDAP
ncbi:S-adenosyl-L-methionine-dependent methyltransferase [Saccharata proteae CBS 121410]|uniref:S-adenosyl-L-methionine-dependent methyltransferase n=1 Tax=Saccharata proteae CBS 121410 TaxID=1314787 RepID=A0A9P4HYT7_9PEZI|nr:S-adenosyl-L-methionine-dependent methyltransferase [Saccharata proteae CBS 121410]